MLYTGETYRTLATRTEEHLRDIRLRHDTPVGLHFNRPDHSIQDFSVTAVWQNSGPGHRRRFMEMHIINTIGTFTPLGINIKSS